MLGRIDPALREVIVIGAGFSGLLAAYRLLKQGYRVTVHEKSNRVGGLIDTIPSEYGLIECAAHSIRSSTAMLELLSDLGLPYVRAKTAKKYICRNGKLRKNPLTLWEMFTAGTYAYFKKSTGTPLTVAQWAKDHVGPGAVDAAFTPLSHGIYAADPEELDQQFAFPRLTIPAGKSFVQKVFGNKTKEEPAFVLSPRDGMVALIHALENFIRNHPSAEIILDSEITQLPPEGNIVLTVPAPIAGNLIGSARLARTRHAPMIVASFFIRESDITLPQGIGYLNARGDDKNILGILFNSSTFDNRAAAGMVSLSAMLGGTGNSTLIEKNDTEIEQIVRKDLKCILGFEGNIQSMTITRWPTALPLYSAELRETLEELRSGWPATKGHVLFGNYTGEISLRGMVQSSLALGCE